MSTLPDSSQSVKLLDAALAYAKRGLHVFPCWWIDSATGACACGGACASPAKHPRTAHGLNDSTIDEATIRAYWAAWPLANVAIDCGRSGLAVIDVDTKKGAVGKATIKWYLEKYPEFQFAELVSTPTGGYHFYFKSATKTAAGALGPGVDVRSVGGYVLAPPSTAFARYGEDKLPEIGSAQPYALLRPTLGAFPPDLPSDLNSAPPVARITLGDIAGDPNTYGGDARPSIPHGEHRQALLWLAWHLRRVHGLTTDAALPTLAAFIESGTLAGYNAGQPFEERDLRGMLERIEPQVAAEPPEVLRNFFEGAITGLDAAADERPVTWLIPYFLQQDVLASIYGAGGVGKSTLASWIGATVTQLGDNFGVVGIEEPFSLFCARAAAMGADRGRLIGLSQPAIGLKFQTHLEWIKRFIVEKELRALYFDAIRTHFELGKGEDSATNTRNNLAGIADLAQREGCLILGTFHDNKEGAYSGSTEMLNVPRIVLELKEAGENAARLRVHKTNGKSPDFRKLFRRDEVPYVNIDGRPMLQTFREPGKPPRIEQQTLPVWKWVCDEPLGKTTLGEVAGIDEEKDAKIRAFLEGDPAMSGRVLQKLMGGNTKYNSAAYTRIKEELGSA